VDRSDYRDTRSTVIGGHLTHPMLVVFPIAFLVSVLATDLAFWGTGDNFWARASEWLLAVGVIMGAFVSGFGLIEFITISRLRSLVAGWVHFLGSAAAILISLWSLLYRIENDPGAAVIPFGIILSAVVVVLFLVTSWPGGELVFRHCIGIIDSKNANACPIVGDTAGSQKSGFVRLPTPFQAAVQRSG
jgi:uncharacterized membrane protein